MLGELFGVYPAWLRWQKAGHCQWFPCHPPCPSAISHLPLSYPLPPSFLLLPLECHLQNSIHSGGKQQLAVPMALIGGYNSDQQSLGLEPSLSTCPIMAKTSLVDHSKYFWIQGLYL